MLHIPIAQSCNLLYTGVHFPFYIALLAQGFLDFGEVHKAYPFVDTVCDIQAMPANNCVSLFYNWKYILKTFLLTAGGLG